MIAMDSQQPAVLPEMVTEEIPRAGWAGFAHDLSRDCVGWRLWIEVMGMSIGDQPLLEGPGPSLEGMSFETQGSAQGDILIEIADGKELFIHQVERPRALRVAHMVPDGLIFVQIVSSDGTVTLVSLQRPLGLPPGRAHARSWERTGNGSAQGWGRTVRASARGWGRERMRARLEARPARYARRRVGDGLLLALVGVSALLLLTRGARSRRGPRGY
jgi:hypothetical protein